METKIFEVDGKKLTLLRYKRTWVLPVFETYSEGLGSPIAMMLYYISDGELELYGDITVNIPNCQHSAGCQFIDTNNNRADILDWLEQNGFGKRTENTCASGFCTYPEFDFYKGEKIWEYKKLSEETNTLSDE